MKMIHSSAQHIPVSDNIAKDIELIARVCANSESKIDDESYLDFIPQLLEHGHESVFEHRRLRVTIPLRDAYGMLGRTFVEYDDPIMHERNVHEIEAIFSGAVHKPWCKHVDVIVDSHYNVIIEANIHAWRDLFRSVDVPKESFAIQYPTDTFNPAITIVQALLITFRRYSSLVGIFFGDLSIYRMWYKEEQDPYKAITIDVVTDNCITVLVETDRGLTHEWVRHRVALTQSSTRYIRYLTALFVDPTVPFKWFGWKGFIKYTIFIISVQLSALAYGLLLKLGCKPQEARNVLPNAFASKLYITGTRSEWKKILALRTASGAHPQMRELANNVKTIIEPLLNEGEVCNGE